MVFSFASSVPYMLFSDRMPAEFIMVVSSLVYIFFLIRLCYYNADPFEPMLGLLYAFVFPYLIYSVISAVAYFNMPPVLYNFIMFPLRILEVFPYMTTIRSCIAVNAIVLVIGAACMAWGVRHKRKRLDEMYKEAKEFEIQMPLHIPGGNFKESE